MLVGLLLHSANNNIQLLTNVFLGMGLSTHLPVFDQYLLMRDIFPLLAYWSHKVSSKVRFF